VQRRIAFITAIPKSASSLLANCIGTLSGGVDFRMYPKWWRMPLGHDWDLRPSIYDHLNDHAAVYKGHFWSNGKNLAVLDMCKEAHYVIVLRSPKDQIAAEFCSALYQRKDNAYNPIHPIDNDRMHRGKVDAGINYLISEGYLLHSLSWMTDWLTFRHLDRSLVIRYEDLVGDPLVMLKDISEWTGTDLSDSQIEDIWARCNGKTKAGATGYGNEYYPRGWTGEVGIWRKYFSEANDEAFQKVYDGFMAANKNGGRLDDLYRGGMA
jgi:hypothetical protein